MLPPAGLSICRCSILRCCCLLLLLAGCCVAPPPAAKFFDRKTPLDALKGFVYAVDARQWDYGYESLTESSKCEIGRFRFAAAVRWAKDPVFHEVYVYDIISDAITRRGPTELSSGGASATIRVTPKARGPDGRAIYFELDLAFRLEEGEWLLDFLETVNAMQRELERGAGDISSR
ncbi:MAG: hypothetical protein HY721_03785 [Planctomycetes bacterium]|nr:hypothetical protein [Planctomycetota bacterium]